MLFLLQWNSLERSFLPDTSKKIFEFINTDLTDYESTKKFGAYVSGTKLNTPEILFNRIDVK